VSKLSTKKISIVLPVYNNADSLPILVEQLLEMSKEASEIFDFEIIFVDDGSFDSSWNIIYSLCQQHSDQLIGIKLSRNFGQMAAMIAGWDHCRGDAVINMSADLQDPVDLIPKMLKEFLGGKDLVIGVREKRNDSLRARFTSKIANRVIKRSNRNMPETWFDFTLMSRRVLNVVTSMTGRHRFAQGDMFYAGFGRAEVPYTRAKRPFGKSGYTFSARIKNFTDSVIDSSYILVQSFIRLGILTAFLSFLYAVWIVIVKIFGWGTPSGWAPIMVVILMTSGIIMVMLGINAEYLWRLYDSSRSKPDYVVDIRTTDE